MRNQDTQISSGLLEKAGTSEQGMRTGPVKWTSYIALIYSKHSKLFTQLTSFTNSHKHFFSKLLGTKPKSTPGVLKALSVRTADLSNRIMAKMEN